MGTKLEYDGIVRIFTRFIDDYEKIVKETANYSDAYDDIWERGYLFATINHLRVIALEIDLIDCACYTSNEKIIEAVKKFIGTD